MSGIIAFTPDGVTFGANLPANVTIDASHANDAISFPIGNTSQRPAPGVPGEVRFNSDINDFEGYIASWGPFGSGIQIQNNNVTIATTKILEFSNGANVILTVSDDAPNTRVNVFIDSYRNSTNGGTINVEANGSGGVNGVANLNFNNTSTINVIVSGYQSETTGNVEFNANLTAIAGPAYAQANLAYGQANSAYTAANAASLVGQQGTLIAQEAYSEANAAYAQANTQGTYANGVVVVSNTANLNFNNTATINVALTANGTQTNIALVVNTSAIAVSGSNYEVDVYANGASVVSNANLNFINTSSINLAVTSNGSTQANIGFKVNTSAVVTSGNTSNLSITYEANGQAQLDYILGQPSSVGGGNYEVDVYANGASVVSNANLNFINTATVNVSITANGSTQANVGFKVNTSAVVASGNTSNVIVSYEANGQAQVDTTYSAPVTTMYDDVFTSTANQTVFSLSQNAYSNVFTIVSVNGLLQTPTTQYGVSNNVLTLLANTNAGDIVEAKIITVLSVSALPITTIYDDVFTASANQSVFDLSQNAVSNVFTLVTVNGLLQTPTTQYGVANNILTLLSNASSGDIVEAKIFANVTLSTGGGGGGNGSITSISTGIGLTGGTITSTGTISANIATTTKQGVTLLVDSISSTDTGNAVTANAVNWALNTANNTSNAALALAANAWIIANAAYAQASSWTEPTLNTSYTTIAGYNPIGFWEDPFGIVHLRGLLEPTANLGASSALNVNIANAFPIPPQNVTFGVFGACANAANTTYLTARAQIYANGALQVLGYTATNGNLSFLTFDSISYSSL